MSEDPKKNEGRRYVTVKEAAEIISLSEKTVRKMVNRGDVPAERFYDNSIRIPIDTLRGRPITPKKES